MPCFVSLAVTPPEKKGTLTMSQRPRTTHAQRALTFPEFSALPTGEQTHYMQFLKVRGARALWLHLQHMQGSGLLTPADMEANLMYYTRCQHLHTVAPERSVSSTLSDMSNLHITVTPSALIH